MSADPSLAQIDKAFAWGHTSSTPASGSVPDLVPFREPKFPRLSQAFEWAVGIGQATPGPGHRSLHLEGDHTAATPAQLLMSGLLAAWLAG